MLGGINKRDSHSMDEIYAQYQPNNNLNISFWNYLFVIQTVYSSKIKIKKEPLRLQ
jgi:hypothetical protein